MVGATDKKSKTQKSSKFRIKEGTSYTSRKIDI